jgi:hypothetical protein
VQSGGESKKQELGKVPRPEREREREREQGNKQKRKIRKYK